MPPATARSVIMVLAALTALVVEREQDTFNALALAALIMLVIDPPILYSASFQLSFAAVGFIVLGGSIARISKGSGGGLAQRSAARLGGLVWVSLVATLATTPLTLRYFDQIQIVGPLTNLFFIPVLGSLVVVTMLGSVTLTLCGLTPAVHLIDLCGTVTGWCIDAARWVAALPFAALETVRPSLIEMTALYLLLGAGLVLLRGKREARRFAGTAALVAVLVLAADAAYWVRERFFFPDLRVTVLDVGQGSSTLLEFPGGETALVDGGGFGEGSGFDTGALIVDPLLRSRKILTLDTLVLTHADSDHLGGLPHVASHFRVRTLLTNGESDGSPAYERLLAIARERGIAMPDFSSTSLIRTAGGAEVTLLYPPADFLSRKAGERWRDLNNNSLVLQVRLGRDRLLLPGDIHIPAEAELVALKGNELASTLLLAPHHGSRTSSSVALLEAVKPREVVFSVGWQNRYRFPHAEVLERYRQQGIRIWRTDLQGAIEIRTAESEEQRLKFWAGRKAAFPAVGRLAPDYYCMDGTIPRGQLPHVLKRISEMSAEFGLAVANVFHAGDGNLHPLILFDANQPDGLHKAEEFGGRILELCVEVGGTITGEHGVGLEKIKQMCTQFATPELTRFHDVKAAFDPDRLLNPGKAVPELHRCAEWGAMHVHDGQLRHPELPRF